MKTTNFQIRGPMDGIGIALSGVCLVHCLIVPIAMTLLPVISQMSALAWLHDNAWFHLAMLLPILLISGPVLMRGAQHNARIGYIGGGGLGLLCAAVFMSSAAMEQMVTTIGTIAMITAHILNIRGRAAP